MRVRTMVVGAGGPAGVNACRALVAAGHEVYAADDNPAHLVWCDQVGARPVANVAEVDVDVIVPQPDVLVRRYAGAPRTFLPSLATINICQAKDAAAALWHQVGLRGPVMRITRPWPDMLHLAADTIGTPFWLRANYGAGAHRAIKVEEIGEAFHWVRFWELRGEDIEWIAEPYLPGRDLAWSSIWFHGDLVACFLRERVEYLYPRLSPEGLTGTPTIAKIAHDEYASEMANEAVLVVDEKPHGIYSVDLREDENGHATPTEINAGRGFTTFGLWSLYDINFVDIAARCAVDVPDGMYIDPLPEGLTLSRHIDCGYAFVREPVYA